jgi:hypothetical protein
MIQTTATNRKRAVQNFFPNKSRGKVKEIAVRRSTQGYDMSLGGGITTTRNSNINTTYERVQQQGCD